MNRKRKANSYGVRTNMMKKNDERRTLPIIVDLTAITGDGSFPCPKCGTIISPDDETEEVYKILNTKVINDQLVELEVECGTCRAVIRLTGFERIVQA